jgi:hypothetical protein
MTLLPRGVKVHLAFGFIDMRKGIDGLAMLVQGVLRQDPFWGTSACSEVGRPISNCHGWSGPGRPDLRRNKSVKLDHSIIL